VQLALKFHLLPELHSITVARCFTTNLVLLQETLVETVTEANFFLSQSASYQGEDHPT